MDRSQVVVCAFRAGTKPRELLAQPPIKQAAITHIKILTFIVFSLGRLWVALYMASAIYIGARV